VADPWQGVILAGTILFTLALVPQLVRTVQLGRADDVSAWLVIFVILASVCNLTYFIHRTEWIAAAGFVVNLSVWPVVLWYRFRPRISPAPSGF